MAFEDTDILKVEKADGTKAQITKATLNTEYGQLAVANTWVGRQQVQHIVDLIRTADDTTAKTMLTFFRGAFDNTKPFFQFVTEGDGAGGVATFSLDSLNRVNIWIADENTGRLAFNTSTFAADLDVTLTVDKKVRLGQDGTDDLDAVTKRQMDTAITGAVETERGFLQNFVGSRMQFTHNLGSKDVHITIKDTENLDQPVSPDSIGLEVYTNSVRTEAFGTVPADTKYRVIVTKV